MNTSKVIVLAVAAGSLVAVAYYTAQEEERVVRSAAAPTTRLLDGITTTSIERIEIRTPEATAPTVLTRMNGDWYTDPSKGYRADRNLVTGALTTVAGGLEGEVVSTNPDSFADYNVDEKSGTQVKLLGPGEKVEGELIVGKDGPASFTTYVRKPGENQVVNANKSLSYVFKKPEGWRDRAILDFGANTITAVEAEGTSATWTLVKSDDAWRMTSPAEHDAQMGKVTPLLSALANLRATDFVEAETTESLTEFGLHPPRQKVTVTHEDRSTSPAQPIRTVLLVGNPRGFGPGEPYYVRRADSPGVALINESQAGMISPGFSEIAVVQAPTPEEAPAVEAPVAETPPVDVITTEPQALVPVAEPEPTPVVEIAPTPATPLPTPEPGIDDSRSTASQTEETTGPAEAAR